MPIIQYSSAFNALDLYVKQHNSVTQDLSSHVRQAMILTAREIIKIYSLSLLKANNIQAVDFENLPSLRTNNVQLAKRCNASTRTIQRHLKRLTEAKIIIKKTWHGSNSSYELWLNDDILLIDGRKAVNKTIEALKTGKSETTKNQSFKKNIPTTCPHTDSGNNSYINNLIIGVDKSKKERSSLPLTSLNESRNATGNAFTGYTEVKCPKKNESAEGNARKKRVTHQTGEKKSPLDLARSATLKIYVSSLWKLAQNTLYRGVYLNQYQIDAAKKLLYKWYEPVPEKSLSIVHQAYVERIEIVRKYLDKKPTERYVQLPDKYFNPENPSGFTGTKKWHESHKKRQKEVQLKLTLQAQIRRFIANENKISSKQKPRLALFRQCETRIGKLGKPELLQQFHASVINHSTYNFLHPNT